MLDGDRTTAMRGALSDPPRSQPGYVIWADTDGSSPDLADGDAVQIELSGIATPCCRFGRVNVR
jgi:hypothetical protein